jgi:hypothetical protein
MTVSTSDAGLKRQAKQLRTLFASLDKRKTINDSPGNQASG